MVYVIYRFGPEAWFNNTGLLFTILIPGPAFGAAFGAIAVEGHDKATRFLIRVTSVLAGFVLWFLITLLWAPCAPRP
jgi:hypothetical protein